MKHHKLSQAIALAIVFLLAIVFIPNNTHESRTLVYEKDYQNEWCSHHHGQQEVVLSDRTRIDCLATINGVVYAIEFDFAKKWSESIGQSLHYSLMTQSTPGIVLILQEDGDKKYADRLTHVITTYNLPIRVWFVHGLKL